MLTEPLVRQRQYHPPNFDLQITHRKGRVVRPASPVYDLHGAVAKPKIIEQEQRRLRSGNYLSVRPAPALRGARSRDRHGAT